jgi:cytochrome P450
MKKLEAVMMYSTLVGIYAWVHPYLYPLLEHIPGTGAAGRTFFINFVRNRIVEREAQRKAWKRDGKGVGSKEDLPKDFLDRLMDLEEDGQAKGVTKYHVSMMGLSNIGAGSDTTGVSLSSVLYHLIKTPDAMEKLRKEVDQAEAEGKIVDNELSWSTSQEMRYLQACLKEGLRLHPATGLPLWRVVQEGGSKVCGQYFPAGEEIGINTWVAHYDKDIWGDDAEIFRPERWIDAEDEGGKRLKIMEEYYMPVRSSYRSGKMPC